DHLLLPSVGKLLGQDAGEPVGDAAGGERNDDADHLARIALRRCAGDCGGERRKGEEDPTPAPRPGSPKQKGVSFRKAIKRGNHLVALHGKNPPSLQVKSRCPPKPPRRSGSKTIARLIGWSRPWNSTSRFTRRRRGCARASCSSRTAARRRRSCSTARRSRSP